LSERLPHHLDGSLFGADNPCFGCSPHHPYGFHLKLERDGEEGVVTRFTPGDKYQGPPGVLHGGLVMTLADEVAAWAILARCGKFGFTASFEGRFRAPVRIGVEALGFGKVVKESSRVVKVHVRIEQASIECFDGTLTFAILDRASAERMLKAPLPEAWAKYAR
jgi:acyl-coenzyme A thioesterase PaaI-like protein